ncbi:hypothetical protein C2G38_2112494 [Gigaspora rosea]|uniref:Uncharacterized protein n=1 Tax=Gigaspora rosea TaxID=44941 RepID=A0A397UKK6_9GLOM|nr:hypothetical protein C2G38_2112494 [Gigaspora rosea]
MFQALAHAVTLSLQIGSSYVLFLENALAFSASHLAFSSVIYSSVYPAILLLFHDQFGDSSMET